jgi:hypothetical protein
LVIYPAIGDRRLVIGDLMIGVWRLAIGDLVIGDR